MSRRGFVSAINGAMRTAAALERAAARQAAAIERAQRLADTMALADTRKAKRLHIETQTAEAEWLTKQIASRVAALEGLLASGLKRDPTVDLDSLRGSYAPKAFDDGKWRSIETPPAIGSFMPPKPLILVLGFGWLLPGVLRTYERKVKEAASTFKKEFAAFEERESHRQASLERGRQEYEAQREKDKSDVAKHNQAIEQLKGALAKGDISSAPAYFELVIGAIPLPDGFPNEVQVAALPDSRQLVIEYEFPSIDVVPEIATYKYNRQRDEIIPAPRTEKQRKELHAKTLAQLTLLILSSVYRARHPSLVDCVTINGMLEAIDPATGRNKRGCVISVRATQDAIASLNLNQVDPFACLKTLSASVSRGSNELMPVKPIIEFDMVDSRFVDTTDIMATLDQRPNLMELSPSDFEALITNLFSKMGLDTKLTQASRDGGVDVWPSTQDPYWAARSSFRRSVTRTLSELAPSAIFSEPSIMKVPQRAFS
jgi:restriction system protein